MTKRYMCKCAPGYYGYNCKYGKCQHEEWCYVDLLHVEFDECDSNPCLNGAECLDLVNQYECSCTPGFSGVTCAQSIYI